MRALSVIALLVPAAVFAGSTRFVQPLEGSQALGRQEIRVETSVESVDRVEFRVNGVLAGVRRTPPFVIPFDFGDELRVNELEATVVSHGFTRRESTSIRTAGLTVNDAIDVDLVEVPVRIRGGVAVLNLRSVKISEDGISQTVRSIERARAPATFHFVIDRSLSMSGEKLSNTVLAVDDARQTFRSDDDASVVTFNHVVDQPVEAKSFTGVAASGGTSLRDAVASVDTSKRSYVIVITDGDDRNSRTTSEEALRRIATSNSAIYAITLGGGAGTTFVTDAAKATGGLARRATASTIRSAMKEIMDDINSRYLVTYQSSSEKKGWRAITIETGGRRVAGARKGYYAR